MGSVLLKAAAEHKRLFVTGVCCSTEETLLRKRLDTLLGSGGFSFNQVTGELTLHRQAVLVD
jgi:hypothetical protein